MNKLSTQKSFAFRRQMQVGAAIANQLKEVMPISEVAKRTGLSKAMVRRIECRALYKIAAHLKAAMAAGEFE